MSITWSWIILVIAGLLEICWAVGLKYTEGFTKPIPSAITLVTLGAGILGIYLFNEAATPLRLFFLGLLLVSIIGLKVTS